MSLTSTCTSTSFYITPVQQAVAMYSIDCGTGVMHVQFTI